MTLMTDDLARSDESSDLVLWILVFSELAAFGILIAGFLVMSLLHAEDFANAQLHLDSRLASAATLVLLASGWLAAAAGRANTDLGRRVGLIGASLLGFGFAAIKLVEYQGEMRFAGDATFSAFFELYFLIAGFHLAHIVFLALVMLVVARKPQPSSVSIVTTLWHVMDMVWLVLLPVLYLS